MNASKRIRKTGKKGCVCICQISPMYVAKRSMTCHQALVTIQRYFLLKKNIVLEAMDASKHIRKITKAMFVYVKFLLLFFKEIDDLSSDLGHYPEIFH